MGILTRLFGRAEKKSQAEILVGLWEQVGMIDPSRGVLVPWPKGSANASIREFFWFFEDGSFQFGRFLADAQVGFDAAARRFVCEKGIDKILTGSWKVEEGRLVQAFKGQVLSVQLGEVSNARFLIEEKTPIPTFVLRVVYERRQLS
jgi:hypothetical protein